MKKISVLLSSAFLFSCSVPDSGSFNVPIENQTNISSFSCERWNQVGEKTVKSTCLVDNANRAELRPVEIRAYDSKGKLIGSALIGKATIGEKVKINKAMAMDEIIKPAKMVLQAVD